MSEELGLFSSVTLVTKNDERVVISDDFRNAAHLIRMAHENPPRNLKKQLASVHLNIDPEIDLNKEEILHNAANRISEFRIALNKLAELAKITPADLILFAGDDPVTSLDKNLTNVKTIKRHLVARLVAPPAWHRA